MNYRHERKHEITYGDMLCLRGRLNAVAHADAHGDHGKYHIRSLYFDNLYDKAFMEKINGVNCREKYRLRYYDGDTSVIHLEKKSKINGLSCKQSVQVTAEQVTQILRGDVAWLQESEEPLLLEFYTKLVNQELRPKTIVDYTREAFTYAPGNVRVTGRRFYRWSGYAETGWRFRGWTGYAATGWRFHRWTGYAATGWRFHGWTEDGTADRYGV